MPHEQGDMTLTDVWGRSDGAVFIAGWYGTILTNRTTPTNPYGSWFRMETNTVEHLTAIFGLENGRRFNQANNVDGEMFAVGWNGTLLHYHPNPTMKPNPVPEDGVWEVVAGIGKEFLPRTKVDPFCPDFDGDGVSDDGGGSATNTADGWWTPNATCKAGSTTTCDDNCRTAANGPERPIRDVNQDGCIQSGTDQPFPTSGADTRNQVDADSDGIGRECDDDETTGNTYAPFRPTFFGIWAANANEQLLVVAVGERGALVTYTGLDAAAPVVAPALALNDRSAWVAQDSLTFRYDNDCDGGTPVGTVCGGSMRLPPSCPAQCHPYRTICECPPDQGQCCDGAASTGAGCGDGTCGPAANACGTPIAGSCSTICPGCFRRLDETLRSISGNAGTLVAVGASGTVLKRAFDVGNLQLVNDTWTRPDCTPMPKPLDERPVFTAVSERDGAFHLSGVGGTMARLDPNAGSCGLQALDPSCQPSRAFITDVFGTGGNRSYAVGDGGVFLQINGGFGGTCTDDGNPDNDLVHIVPTKVPQNFNALWVTRVDDVERIWMVGAQGIVIRASYF